MVEGRGRWRGREREREREKKFLLMTMRPPKLEEALKIVKTLTFSGFFSFLILKRKSFFHQYLTFSAERIFKCLANRTMCLRKDSQS